MKCNPKSMLIAALALGLVATVAYFTFPAAKAFILASTPLLVALICPVSMLVMMKTKNGGNKGQDARADERAPSPRIGETGSERV